VPPDRLDTAPLSSSPPPTSPPDPGQLDTDVLGPLDAGGSAAPTRPLPAAAGRVTVTRVAAARSRQLTAAAVRRV
jgi:hypothetical protein